MSNRLFNLTYPQKNIWLLEMANKGTNINVISGVLKVKNSQFNEKIYNRVMNELVRLNDGLRIRIKIKNKEPKQFVKKYSKFNIESLDLSNLSKANVNKRLKIEMSKPMKLIDNNLFEFKSIKYSENEGAILYRCHHIISDAWALIQLASQFATLYEKFSGLSSNDDIMTENFPSYLEYINSEEEYFNSDKKVKDKEYWNEYLKNIKEPVYLKENKNINTYRAKRHIEKLDSNLNENINNFCKENKISQYVLFMAAFSTYIYRVKETDDFIIGTPVLNRFNAREKQMLGMFVSTIPMRFNIDENISFIELARQITTNTLNIFRHHKYPYSKILEDIRSKTEMKSNLYKLVLSYQNARAFYPNIEKYESIWSEPNFIQDDLVINIVDINNCGELEIYYDYLVELFDKKEIEFLHERIIEIIKEVILNKNTSIEDINIFSKKEEKIINSNFNNSNRSYQNDKTIVELFEEQVKINSTKTALIFENKEFTFKEINEKSNQLADYLLKSEIKSNIIPLILKRSPYVIIAILGILKAGKAFLPIDRYFPKDRIDYMIENAGAKNIIKSRDISYQNDLVDEFIVEDFKFEDYDNKNKKVQIGLDDLIYIIYTSGTTGLPKGVMISNSNAVNLVFAVNDYQKLNKIDKFISFSTYSFDIFILETFVPLCTGKTMILSNEDEQILPSLMSDLIIKNKAKVLSITPTRMKLLLDYDIEGKAVSYLRRIMLGGEVFPRKFYDYLSLNSKAKIYDGYGPTEITVWATSKLIQDKGNINIGKPLPNVKVYVLDSKQRLLPIGCEGELYIGGLGVGLGYLNNPQVTKQKFVTIDGQKLYRTGDFCYFDFSGDLHYVGRRDSQIKLRGYRIEKEEIEEIIRNYKGINQVVVLLDSKNNLCTYFTSNEDVSLEKLKKYLKEKLPRYMIPQLYMRVKKFDINILGKIDEKNLPVITPSTVKYEVPHNETQKIIANSIAKILNKPKIGINDNFFDLGLDSLEIIKLIGILESKKIELRYGDFFKYLTVKNLSEVVNNKKIKNKDNTNDLKGYDYATSINVLKNNTVEYIDEKIELKKFDNVLIAGATGFLGAHIVDAFLKKENCNVYCISRSKNNVDYYDRVVKSLEFYFGKDYILKYGKKLSIIEGDITKEKFVDDIEIYKLLVDKVDLVINSAAHVKHYGNYEKFEKINVETTKILSDYCSKFNKRFIQISTLSVSGNILESGFVEQKRTKGIINFDETSFFVNQNLKNVYAKTKFISERYVLEKISKGLDAKIIRVGNLTGRYSDGKSQINVQENAFLNRIKVFTKIKKVPNNFKNIYLEFSPVEYVSSAIVDLSKIDGKYNLFHVFNHNHVYFSEIQKIFNKLNINLKYVDEKAFSDLVAKHLKDKNKIEDISGIVMDLNKNKTLSYKTNIKIDSKFTLKILEKIGFKWPIINEKYVIKLMNYLKKINFIDF